MHDGWKWAEMKFSTSFHSFCLLYRNSSRYSYRIRNRVAGKKHDIDFHRSANYSIIAVVLFVVVLTRTRDSLRSPWRPPKVNRDRSWPKYNEVLGVSFCCLRGISATLKECPIVLEIVNLSYGVIIVSISNFNEQFALWRISLPLDFNSFFLAIFVLFFLCIFLFYIQSLFEAAIVFWASWLRASASEQQLTFCFVCDPPISLTSAQSRPTTLLRVSAHFFFTIRWRSHFTFFSCCSIERACRVFLFFFFLAHIIANFILPPDATRSSFSFVYISLCCCCCCCWWIRYADFVMAGKTVASVLLAVPLFFQVGQDTDHRSQRYEDDCVYSYVTSFDSLLQLLCGTWLAPPSQPPCSWFLPLPLSAINSTWHATTLNSSSLQQSRHEEAHVSCWGGFPLDCWMDPAGDWVRKRGTRHHLLHHAA